ncbi:replication restart helicase PriA [Alphaproteobacteria bacterium endosymbiont of Tiliacea citrago]|uniref:replication restart helicase PriA n=1 Tax=Alphaproteobacteria bacterium endosymbiont of Tiliacea citrago TaxID=3077944 RepID=UPI00313F3002
MFFFNVYAANSFCSKPYIYAYSEDLEKNTVVSISFGTKTCFGVIISKSTEIPNYKTIIKAYKFILKSTFFSYLLNFASYYYLNIGAVLELVFPSIAFQKGYPILLEYNEKNYALYQILKILPLKKIKELKKITCQENIKNIGTTIDIKLSEDQKKAVLFIKNSKKTCLLEGVTGSGKTIVALKSIKDFSKKILILVPEINLAYNWVKTIEETFNIIPFVYNSKISKSFKKSFYNWAISDDPGIIIGTRSALMIPYSNLDYIIIDEEHSTSYRQDVYPYYNARDMAILLSKNLQIQTLLLSATPSLETIYNIKANKYDHIKLIREPKHGLAKISYIKGNANEILSAEILSKVKKTFEKNQQVLFFLNRKGYSPYCYCNKCKNILMCKDCESALTFYLGYKIICHKCNKKNYLPKTCPDCNQSTTWSFWGLGVQKLNEFLLSIFPNNVFSVITCDSEDISEQLNNIYENKINGIIATQILAQGYDFKNIALVIVVDADMGLVSTDFRAMEKIYQLWQQIRGRSGRHDIQGEMILQNFKKENRFLELFKKNNVISYLLEDRYKFDWPPFSKTAFLKFKGKNREKLEKFVDSLQFNNPKILGPMFFGLQNKIFEFRFLVKAKNHLEIKEIINPIYKKFKTKIEIEIDPY